MKLHRSLSVAGVLLLPVVVAPAAYAATPNRVAIDPSSLSPVLRDLVVTTGDTKDRIFVSRDATAYVVDVSTGATAGTGCEATSATIVRCPLPADAITRVAVDTGAGDDAVTINDGVPRALLRGGPGKDALFGGRGNDELYGGPGDDWLWGNSGSDTFRADSTVDGSDRIEGGDGHDIVDYRDRTTPVTVTLGFDDSDDSDGSAADGSLAEGEKDFVEWDVESATGGRGADTLVGDDDYNILTGGPGADTITGGDGADQIFGDAGADTIDGGAGNDWIDDGNGADRVSAGPGDDEIEPTQTGTLIPADLYDGGEGSDTITYGGLRSTYAGVVVSLNGLADDGVPGENDNVLGFETVIGTSLDDRLTGGPGEETLIGSDGADVLDTVDGTPGDWADGGNGTGDVCLIDAGDTAVDCEN